MPKITGGYYIKARKIQDSAIAKSPPHVREIWDWLLKMANHKDAKTYGTIIQRGQVFTSYAEIQEDLSWKIGFVKKLYKKHQVDNAMAWLRQEQMITTQKTTRGLIVTICNYDYYQDPSNYEYATDSDNEATGKRQDTTTIHKNGNNDNKEEIKYNRGTGDFTPPVAPPPAIAVFRAPDGSLVKEATIQFTANDFNGLPDIYANSIINSIKSIKNIDIEKERIITTWEGFKITEMHKKLYRSREDVYSFFSNFCKKQVWKSDKSPPRKENKPKGKVIGVEFINDFTQCKMSDGSVQDLEVNQKDLAKYNQISPKDILKN